jgi:hypothetical protein
LFIVMSCSRVEALSAASCAFCADVWLQRAGRRQQWLLLLLLLLF